MANDTVVIIVAACHDITRCSVINDLNDINTFHWFPREMFFANMRIPFTFNLNEGLPE